MSKAVDKQVNLNIDELKDFLTHIINNNHYLQANGKVPVAVNCEGGAGIGKTSTIIQLAKELNMSHVRLNLAQVEELGDIIGFPIRQFEVCKEVTTTGTVAKEVTDKDGNKVMRNVTAPVVNRECLWIDEHAVESYTGQGYTFTGQSRMNYCPPEWIAGLEDKPGILILDDYSRADQRFIQACMTLIETQEYISWSLPKGWTILLTTNPDDGEYLVTPMDMAQKTRFITTNVKFDVTVWAKWAEKEGIDGRCINFLLMHPELVKGSCNARSIVTFFNSISSIPDFSKELGLVQMIGEGSVGLEFASMFNLFINNRLDKLISPREILLNDSENFVIGEMRTCIGQDKDYRADIASALTTRLINFTVNYAEEGNPITQKVLDRLIKLITDEKTLTDDLKYVLVKKILNADKTKFQRLMANFEVMKVTMK